MGLPSTGTQLGFAFNRNNNTIYIRKSFQKAIMKYDGYLKKVHKTTFEQDQYMEKTFYGLHVFSRGHTHQS